MPSNPEPTQPLTEEALAHVRRRLADPLAQPSAWEARLLAEVDRLRAELDSMTKFAEDLREERDRRLRSEGELGVELDRLRAENTAQARQLAAAHELHRPVNHRGLRVCNACTPLDVLMQAVSGRGRRGVEYPCPTARALGVGDSGEKGYTNSCTPDDQGQSAPDQSGEGQSDEG